MTAALTATAVDRVRTHVLPGRAPSSRRSTAIGFTGRSDCASASATNVCRAQQAKS